jgi:hypothetical protein
VVGLHSLAADPILLIQYFKDRPDPWTRSVRLGDIETLRHNRDEFVDLGLVRRSRELLFSGMMHVEAPTRATIAEFGPHYLRWDEGA